MTGREFCDRYRQVILALGKKAPYYLTAETQLLLIEMVQELSLTVLKHGSIDLAWCLGNVAMAGLAGQLKELNQEQQANMRRVFDQELHELAERN